jgi:hypothetical protein
MNLPRQTLRRGGFNFLCPYFHNKAPVCILRLHSIFCPLLSPLVREALPCVLLSCAPRCGRSTRLNHRLLYSAFLPFVFFMPLMFFSIILTILFPLCPLVPLSFSLLFFFPVFCKFFSPQQNNHVHHTIMKIIVQDNTTYECKVQYLLGAE